ncbi:hypothetical protein ONZ43_g7229 [Nemania bipapillata]|uniref:Uncharacterized protein n=1 Tax=Nemania bipapillata TaxID=110536 RepID=A0ACC2HT49_9PEZI|nr:hypothetical protein ONZ43_g7229 [Nemania bipapillata]
MANNWTQEEWDNGRRLVLFSKKQQGSTLSTTFKAVSVSERPPNSICISCIYWPEKRECFVTSVDTISLLEQLVAAPSRFTVDEKNRIRRNLEGFRPLTVSKAKADSEEFFKVIMGFPTPRPRNIEKDVKVFPWKILAPALKKIISKYSASPSNAALHHPAPPYHPSSGPPLLTPLPTPRLSNTSFSALTIRSAVKLGSLHGARAVAESQVALTTDGRNPHRWDGYSDAPTTPTYASHQHPGHVYGTSAYSGGHHRE